MLRFSGSTSWSLLVVVFLSNDLISTVSGFIPAEVNWGNSSSLLSTCISLCLSVFCVLFSTVLPACLLFFLPNSRWNCPTSHHMVGACCGEEFLFFHLSLFELILCITLGFLYKSLTQCGFCLPKMALISLSFPVTTYFVLVHGPLKVRLMLLVS